MLVLTRKQEQSIQIGEQIEVTIIEVREGQVRLGIRAPRETRVDRSEIAESAKCRKLPFHSEKS